MELTSRMKMTRFQTFWIQIRKNKPLDETQKSQNWTNLRDENDIPLLIKSSQLKSQTPYVFLGSLPVIILHSWPSRAG
ncbi:hypothetical protein Hanom_Chr13g01231451 [Helianthus anomalus]